MKAVPCHFLVLALCFIAFSKSTWAQEERFNAEKDLLLAQFDCKTDVDDLHTVAAFKSLMVQPDYSNIQYHAVAGTYGEQEGLYVPPNSLFKIAFGTNWTDAHKDFDKAVSKVKKIVLKNLKKGGNIWIAEAGQSDFSAALMKAVTEELPQLDLKQRFYVVQHSDWNEKATSAEALQYVRENSTYHKIPDGNAAGNGTPGFRSGTFTQWGQQIDDPQLLQLWEHAVELGLKFNGKDGRYNNEAVAKGGLDFSDLSEICWLLGIEDIQDTEEFFSTFLANK